jgi:hypothetical protein
LVNVNSDIVNRKESAMLERENYMSAMLCLLHIDCLYYTTTMTSIFIVPVSRWQQWGSIRKKASHSLCVNRSDETKTFRISKLYCYEHISFLQHTYQILHWRTNGSCTFLENERRNEMCNWANFEKYNFEIRYVFVSAERLTHKLWLVFFLMLPHCCWPVPWYLNFRLDVPNSI